MKNIIIIFTIISAIFAEGISGVSYFRYAMGSAADGEDHGFYIDRAYLTYKKDVSENVSFKFQTDIKNLNSGDGWQLYLKNAKMNFQVHENYKLIFGLQGMNMFNVQEKNWGNRFIAKSAMDGSGWSPAADLGIGVVASFGEISGSVLFTNGEGYKNSSSDDNERISTSLIYNGGFGDDLSFNVGGVFSMLNYISCGCGDACACNSEGPCSGTCTADGCEDGCDCGCEADITAQVMGVFGGFSGLGLRVGAEYNMGTDLNIDGYETSSTLMSLYGTYSLSFIKGFSVLAKYDILDTDTGADDTETTTLLAGVSYQCAEGITFSPNMTQTTVGAEDPTTAINLTLQLKF